MREPSVFSYKVEGTFRSCLDRQVQEGVRITLDNSDEIMNSKSEHHQPGVMRVVTTREGEIPKPERDQRKNSQDRGGRG